MNTFIKINQPQSFKFVMKEFQKIARIPLSRFFPAVFALTDDEFIWT